MFKKISKFTLLLVISLSTSINSNANIDSIITDTDNLKPFNWEVISGVEKLVSTKDMSKSKIKKLEEGNALYSEGIEMMINKNYIGAIEKFKLARKSYRMPLRDNPHYYNFDILPFSRINRDNFYIGIISYLRLSLGNRRV